MNNSTIVRKCKGVICPSIFLGFALTVSALPSKSQQTTLLQEIQSMNLPVDKGKITVYYASGYEKRAAEVRPLIEEGMGFYERSLNLNQEFSVAILTREQWTKLIQTPIQGIPYGL